MPSPRVHHSLSTHCVIASTVAWYPEHQYEEIKNTILGRKYLLSLSFIGTTRARHLNQTTRHKDYIPNVLSFPYDHNHGEIYICPAVAVTEAADFSMTPEQYIGYLYIHGLLHLKGYDHGSAMTRLEKRYLKQFKLL